MAQHSCIIKKMVRVDLLTAHGEPPARHVGAGASVGAAIGALVGAALGTAVGAAIGAGEPPFLAFAGSGALGGLAGAGAFVLIAFLAATLESIRTGTRVRVMNFMMNDLMKREYKNS